MTSNFVDGGVCNATAQGDAVCAGLGSCVADSCVCPFLYVHEASCAATYFGIWTDAALIYGIVRFLSPS